MPDIATDASRRTRKRVQTRDHIAATAFALFDAHGYEAVTMEQIAAGADVARGTLYNHFPVKEAVLAHGLHAQLARDLAPLMRTVLAHDSLAGRLAVLLAASAGWWEAHRHYAMPYIRYRFQQARAGHPEDAASDMVSVYAGLIAQAQEQGELDPRQAPARLAHYLHYLYLGALMAWLADADVSLGDELARVIDFFMRGAAAAPAPRAR